MSTSVPARTGEQLRASRRRRMADAIELTALRLFAEHGVDAVTVDDIADAADISRRTFFRYYASKDDIVHGNPERQLEILRAALDAAPSTATPRALVRRALLTLTAELEKQRETILLRKRIAANSPAAMAQGHGRHNALVDAMIDAVATHMRVDPDTDLRPRVYVLAGMGAIQAAVRNWFTTGTASSLEEIASEALDLIDMT